MDRELIKNREEILDHGNSCLRQEILSIIQAGIISGDPGTGTRRQVRLSDGNLWVGTRFYRLDEINMIYIVGAGKGSFPIAEALETILGERISEGVCVVKRGETRRLKHIEIYEASHPIPDDTSLEGAKKILRIARQAGETATAL